jgi:hypothetical protein
MSKDLNEILMDHDEMSEDESAGDPEFSDADAGEDLEDDLDDLAFEEDLLTEDEDLFALVSEEDEDETDLGEEYLSDILVEKDGDYEL